jgi:hypothetical protein
MIYKKGQTQDELHKLILSVEDGLIKFDKLMKDNLSDHELYISVCAWLDRAGLDYPYSLNKLKEKVQRRDIECYYELVPAKLRKQSSADTLKVFTNEDNFDDVIIGVNDREFTFCYLLKMLEPRIFKMSFILSKNATHEDLLEIINPSLGKYLIEKSISDAFIDVFITPHKDILSTAFTQSGLNYHVQRGGIATMYNNTRHRYNTYHIKTSNINHVQPIIHGFPIPENGVSDAEPDDVGEPSPITIPAEQSI